MSVKQRSQEPFLLADKLFDEIHATKTVFGEYIHLICIIKLRLASFEESNISWHS